MSDVTTMDNPISQANKRALRNPWVLGWLALVAVVLGVNIYMISMAFITSPGLVSKNYYEQGRDYERTVQSRSAARAALGWDVALEVSGVHMGKPAAFRIVAKDKDNRPLAESQVKLFAYRPSDVNADFSTVLAEKVPGEYVGDVVFPLKGAWDLVVEVKQGEDIYQVPRRLAVLAN